MAKLTAAQERSIETVMYHLNRANEYLMKESTVVAQRQSMATTTLDYTNAQGEVITSVCKDIGSDLAGLQMAMQYLQNFVKMNSKDYKPGQE